MSAKGGTQVILVPTKPTNLKNAMQLVIQTKVLNKKVFSTLGGSHPAVSLATNTGTPRQGQSQVATMNGTNPFFPYSIPPGDYCSGYCQGTVTQLGTPITSGYYCPPDETVNGYCQTALVPYTYTGPYSTGKYSNQCLDGVYIQGECVFGYCMPNICVEYAPYCYSLKEPGGQKSAYYVLEE